MDRVGEVPSITRRVATVAASALLVLTAACSREAPDSTAHTTTSLVDSSPAAPGPSVPESSEPTAPALEGLAPEENTDTPSGEAETNQEEPSEVFEAMIPWVDSLDQDDPFGGKGWDEYELLGVPGLDDLIGFRCNVGDRGVSVIWKRYLDHDFEGEEPDSGRDLWHYDEGRPGVIILDTPDGNLIHVRPSGRSYPYTGQCPTNKQMAGSMAAATQA